MTHPPSLPNGFSRDFSEAPTYEPPIEFWALADREIAYAVGRLAFDQRSVWVCGHSVPISDCLCWREAAWASFPTPGDAVLKELAEGK